MKHAIFGIFAASALAGALALHAADGGEQAVWTDYMNWDLRPDTVKSENAQKEVRNTKDLTVPMHGPWLTNPEYTAMTISWISRIPCGGGLEYREKGTEDWKRVWQTTYGQIHYGTDIHSFHLTGLKPGTEYEYRLVSSFEAWECSVGREINAFRTLDPKRDRYMVFITSDFHGGSRLTLNPMVRNTNALNADMFFFLGDNIEDSLQNARYYTTFGLLDDVTRVWGKTKPSLFLRGNHDSWGKESWKYGEYFPRPDGKSYFTVLQGPVLFICFDYFGVGARRNVVSNQANDYMLEQIEWYKALKKTAAWKNAKFRIAMAHVGTHACEGQETETNDVLKQWKAVLNDPSPEGRIHLFLCGHEHIYRRIDPLAQETKVSSGVARHLRQFTSDFHYGLVVLHQGEGMTLDVTPEKLTFKSHRWTDKKGGLYDAFEVTPDGKIKDLMDVRKFPLTWPEKKK